MATIATLEQPWLDGAAGRGGQEPVGPVQGQVGENGPAMVQRDKLHES